MSGASGAEPSMAAGPLDALQAVLLLMQQLQQHRSERRWRDSRRVMARSCWSSCEKERASST